MSDGGSAEYRPPGPLLRAAISRQSDLARHRCLQVQVRAELERRACAHVQRGVSTHIQFILTSLWYGVVATL